MKDRLQLFLIALALVTMVVGAVYGYQERKACESKGGVYARVYGHFGNQCFLKGK